MSAAVLAHRAGAVAVAGPPDRSRGPQAASTVTSVASRLVGPGYILASCASLLTAAALATTLFASFGPAGTGALRFFAAAFVLMVLVRPRVRGRSARGWLAIAALGAATAATNFFLYEAIARIPLGTAGTLVFLGPLTLALLRTRRRLDVAWAIAAGLGVILLTGGPAGGSLPGVGFAFAAAASVAASILIARRVGEHTHGLDGLALSISVAALITLPVGVPAALDIPDLADVLMLVLIGVLGIAIPYALEFSALRRIGVRTYSILLSLDPAVAGLAGLLLLGQRLNLAELLGVALVMVASAAAVATQPPAR
ncbi:MAG: EamA family transporter [Solirubrobacteraceae bacterium]